MRPPYSQHVSKVATLRAHGCTLFSLLWLRAWASDGAEAPVSQGAIDKAVNGLQKSSGASMAQFLDRGTKLDEAIKAYKASPFAGRSAPTIRSMNGGNVRDDLVKATREGKAVLCFVNYGVVQDGGKGVGSFRGGHAVVAVEGTSPATITIIDPLRSQAVPWTVALLEKAMERFGTKPWMNGRGVFAIVYKSRTTADLVKAQRDAARKDLAALKIQLAAALKTPPVTTIPDPELLAQARAGGIKDAAAAAASVK